MQLRNGLRFSASSIAEFPFVRLTAHVLEHLSNFCCLPGSAGGLPFRAALG
jgi:hypothetical protein